MGQGCAPAPSPRHHSEKGKFRNDDLYRYHSPRPCYRQRHSAWAAAHAHPPVSMATACKNTPCIVSAQDAIKSGKWEISTVNPGVTQLPPGLQLGPGQQLGPEGLTAVRTKCISATNPLFPPQPPPEGVNSPCTIEKSDLIGDAATWMLNCASAQATHLMGRPHPQCE